MFKQSVFVSFFHLNNFILWIEEIFLNLFLVLRNVKDFTFFLNCSKEIKVQFSSKHRVVLLLGNERHFWWNRKCRPWSWTLPNRSYKFHFLPLKIRWILSNIPLEIKNSDMESEFRLYVHHTYKMANNFSTRLTRLKYKYVLSFTVLVIFARKTRLFQ